MAELQNICVYCGSNNGRLPEYAAAAEEFGRVIAESGVRLVYGGGSVGLMGILARAVMKNGGKVTGIIPQFLKDREVMLKEVTDLSITDDMHARKQAMFERADAFVALPGGIGTLEELVEIMTWAQLERHMKPIVIVNIKGFWDPLIALLGRMTEEGFMHKAFIGGSRDLPAEFVDDVRSVIPTIRAALHGIPRPPLPKAKAS